MATLLLGGLGRVVGELIGGPIGAAIGGAIGAAGGSVIDQQLFARTADATRKGPRLKTTDVMTSTEGAAMPRLYGRQRITGQVIWQTRFEEVINKDKETVGGSGKGGGSGTTIKTVDYLYYGNFAVAFGEGQVTRVGRIWFDGKEVDQTDITFRVHKGGEAQTTDALIEAKEGTGDAPAYRGTAYIVFERLLLTDYGNRLPQVSAELYRNVGDLEDAVEGVAIIPGTTEFGYDPRKVKRKTSGKSKTPDNRHNLLADSDFEASINALEELAPNCGAVSLVVAWFGDDLRCGDCTIRPKVENATKETFIKWTPEAASTSFPWHVAGLDRGDAEVVSQYQGRPAYGGSPNDASVVRAIRDLNDRGFKVTLYPFVMMDIPSDNTLPDPYSDDAGDTGQAAHPWRGRITCSPAPGYDGSPDKTATAATQVTAFLGTAAASDFTVLASLGSLIGLDDWITGGGTAPEWLDFLFSFFDTIIEPRVGYTGPDEWSYRRFVLHCAALAKAAGGVDGFCIGSEMVGLTTVRSAAGTYPFVDGLVDLAAEVRTLVGAGVKIGYAADWSEYHSHRPADGSGDVYFHLDPLWSDLEIDFIGIDNYLPLADWRDGTGHADYDAAAGPTIPHDPDYLAANVEGGEDYDWFYADDAARDAQSRTSIVDSAEGKHWVFRQKDIRNWWQNAHYDRPGGVEAGSPTGWTAESKPVWFTELGCPAVDKGANQPNLFSDAKSSESGIPYYSSGARDDAMQRAYLQAVVGYWADHGNNPVSAVYGDRMIRVSRIFVWAWDARPGPSFPEDETTWADGANWQLGHWVSGRLGAAPARETIEAILADAAFADYTIGPMPSVVDGAIADSVLTPRAMLEALQPVHAFDAVESEGVIKFSARAAHGVLATLAAADLVTPDDGRAFDLTRAQETELPDVVRLGYGDPTIDDQPSATEARRSAGSSRRTVEIGLPVVMDAGKAQAAAEIALYEPWIGRERLQCGLPPSWLAYDPGDLLLFAPTGDIVRLTGLADAVGRQVEGERADPLLYVPQAAPHRKRLPRPSESTDPEAIFLDGPLLQDDDKAHRGYVGASMRPWRSGIALYKAPTTSGYVFDRTLATPAIIGETTADFYSGPVWRFDRVNDLYLSIDRGTLSSVSEDSVLNGENAIAVENADGEWEILQFATATLNGSGNYILSDLLRGQRGSEHAMRDPVAAGARVLVLDGALRQPGIKPAEVGLALSWSYGPADRDQSNPDYVTETVTMTGRGRRPYAPVQLRGRRDHATGDWTLSWIRRTRIGGDSWDVAEVLLGEDSEAYRLDILDALGGSVLRAVDLDTTAYLYTAAMQTADFGAPVWNVPMRVTQLSAIYGDGIAAEYLTYHH